MLFSVCKNSFSYFIWWILIFLIKCSTVIISRKISQMPTFAVCFTIALVVLDHPLDLISSLQHDDARSLIAGTKTYITIKSSTHWHSINVYWLKKISMSSWTWLNLLWVGYSDLPVCNFVKIVFQFIKLTVVDLESEVW